MCILCMLVFYGHAILAHNAPRACNFAFLPHIVFLQTLEFWHQQFPFSIDLTMNFVINHVQLAITPTTPSTHGNFIAEIFWNTHTHFH